MTAKDSRCGKAQYNISDKFSDGPVEEKSETLPCQGNSLYTFMRVENESLAKEAMEKMASPLPAYELEENPLDDDGEEVAEEGPMRDGVPYNSVIADIKQQTSSDNLRIREAAQELQNMDLLFNSVEKEMKGPKEFMTFMALFSLQGRQTDTDSKGKWNLNLNGKDVPMNKAEFSVEFHQKYDQKYYINPYDNTENIATSNVHIFGNTLFNDKFKVLVTPALRTKYYEYGGGDEPDKEVDYGNTLNEYHTKTIDELAKLIVQRIYSTVEFNNKVDWWTDKTLTALEIAFTVASLCTGVGVVLKVGHLFSKTVHAVMIVVDASVLTDSTTRFLGVNEKGYNPLLAGAKYLDENTHSDKFETVFHAMNMMMVFGAKSRTQVLTALGTGGAGAAAHLSLKEGKTQQEVITALEDDSNYNEKE